ncbi:MAG: alpha/beta fold hydrolase [Burkholderiaceae bacterium]
MLFWKYSHRRLLTAFTVSIACITGGANGTELHAKAVASAVTEQAGGAQVHRISSSILGAELALWREIPSGKNASDLKHSSVVLFIHGATISGGMSAAYKIDGYSWVDNVAQSGRDAWTLDFLGYGRSDAYPAMKSGIASGPLGGASDLIPDIDRAVDYIRAVTGASKITIVATSRGAIPAGYYVAQHPEKIDRIVFNSPIVRRNDTPAPVIKAIFGFSERPTKAYYDIPTAKRLDMILEDRPENTEPQLETGFIEHWPIDSKVEAENFNHGGGKNSLRVPGGFARDIYDAWHGTYWNPAEIKVPALIVRGDYDRILTRPDDAQWLYDQLTSAPSKRYVLIDKGTHAMLFERKRFELYQEVLLFLQSNYDQRQYACSFCGGR